tara:strand:- start:5910 stop:6101 length:192 start_codon:yes stop_codon:yes gene_type:complete
MTYLIIWCDYDGEYFFVTTKKKKYKKYIRKIKNLEQDNCYGTRLLIVFKTDNLFERTLESLKP